MLLLAHVSDLHLDGGSAARDRVAAVVAYVAGLPRPADGVLVTGDVADHGAPAEYAEAREIFAALRCPVGFLPGNHDDRQAFRSFVAAGGATVAGSGPVNQVWRLAGATFALCDSTVPGMPGGLLADGTREWLDAVVGRVPAAEPLVICLHHPPVDVHSGLIDPMRLAEEQRLATVLARRTGGTYLLCGHAHTPAMTSFAGVPLVVAPGVRSTLRMPWEHEPDTADVQRAPALALHVLDGGRLTTHVRWLPGDW